MKIIGTTGNRDTYLAEITHREIEEVMDKTGYGSHGAERLKELRVGEDFPISAGYDFRNDVRGVCYSMTQAMDRFEAARKTFAEFVKLVAAQPDHTAQPKQEIKA